MCLNSWIRLAFARAVYRLFPAAASSQNGIDARAISHCSVTTDELFGAHIC